MITLLVNSGTNYRRLVTLQISERILKIWVAIDVPSKLCACARTRVVRRAHTQKFGAHINVPSKNVFCTYFMHVIPNSNEFWQNVAQKNCMHTQT